MKLNKSFLIVIVLALVSASILAYFLSGDFRENLDENTENLVLEFARPIELTIKLKTSTLSFALKSSVVIAEIKKANETNQSLTLKKIIDLDKNWQYSEENKNPATLELIEFQKNNPEFSEIFITDKFGLNVAQTNKTLDYYQADEYWWTRAYNNGNGMEYHGVLEFAESGQTDGISIYVPINDPDTGKIIGIAKAVLSVEAIKDEF